MSALSNKRWRNLPFFKLQQIVFNFLRHSDDFDGIKELQSELSDHRSEFLGTDPFYLPSRSENDKNSIASLNPILLGHSVQLNVEIARAIIELSERLDANEIYCGNVWAAVSDANERRELEIELGLPTGMLQNNIALAAEHLVFHERMQLITCLSELLKARTLKGIISEKQNIIREELDSLINQGLATNLMECLKKLIRAQSRTLIPSLSSRTVETRMSYVSSICDKAAECIFFIFYTTVIEHQEAIRLVELLDISSSLLKATSRDLTEINLTEKSQMAGIHMQDMSRPSSLLRANTMLIMSLTCAFDTRGGRAFRNKENQPVENNESNLPNNILLGFTQAEFNDLHDQIVVKRWENEHVQGSVALSWAVFMAPAVDSGLKDPEIMESALISAFENRGISHLSGPVLTVLLCIRSLPDNSSSIYLDVFSDLVEGYLLMGWSTERQNAWGSDILPASREEYERELKFEQAHSATILRRPNRRVPDCLDEISYWIAVTCESYKPFCERCWKGDVNVCLAVQLLFAVDERTRSSRTLQVSFLHLASAFALFSPNCIYEQLRSPRYAFGWQHFLTNLEKVLISLDGGNSKLNFRGPAPSQMYPLSDRAANILAAFSLLLKQCLLNDEIRTLMLTEFASLPTLLMRLALSPVPLVLRGIAFQSLASLIKDKTLPVWALKVLNDTKIATIEGGGGASQQLEIESQGRIYSTTEGFLIFCNQLFTSEIPMKSTFPYVAFIVKDVLYRANARVHRFHGEKWKLIALALQGILVVLRKYASESSPQYKAYMNGKNPEFRGTDLLSNTIALYDPQQKTSNKTASSDTMVPGYVILEELLRGGQLFSVVTGILTEDGGINGFQSDRLKWLHLQAIESMRDEDAFERVGWQLPSDQCTIEKKWYREDWGWWREHCSVLVMSIFQAAIIQEDSFKLRIRKSPTALHQPLLHSASQLALMPVETSYAKSHTKFPLSSIVELLANAPEREPISVLLEDSVISDRSACIPLLSVDLLLRIMQRIPQEQVLRAAIGTTNSGKEKCYRISAIFFQRLVGNWTFQDSNHMPALDYLEDANMLGLSTILLLANENTAIKNDMMKSNMCITRTARCALLDLLLFGVKSKRPNLSHALLGLNETVNRQNSLSRDIDRSEGTREMNRGCVLAVLWGAQDPEFYFKNSTVAERMLNLFYELCVNPATNEVVIPFLESPQIDFYVRQVQNCVIALQNHAVPSNYHALSWLLKGAARCLQCTKNTLRSAQNRLLVRLLDARSGQSCLADILNFVPLKTLTKPTGLPMPAQEAIRFATVKLKKPQSKDGHYEIIDISKLKKMLRESLTFDGLKRAEIMDEAINWALEYNKFTYSFHGQAHLVSSWRNVIECASIAATISEDSIEFISSFSSLNALSKSILSKLDSEFDGELEFFQSITSSMVVVFYELHSLERTGCYLSLDENQFALSTILKLASSHLISTNGNYNAMKSTIRLHLNQYILEYLCAFARRFQKEIKNNQDLLEVSYVTELDALNVMLFTHAYSREDLVLAIGSEFASSQTTVLQRSISFSLLSETILFLLSGAREIGLQDQASMTVVNMLNSLHNRGFLESAICAATDINSEFGIPAINFLISVASIDFGARILVDLNIIRRMSLSHSKSKFEIFAFQVTTLMEAIITSLPDNKSVANQMCQFLKRNITCISDCLDVDKIRTLSRLKIIGVICGLLEHISGPNFSDVSENISNSTDFGDFFMSSKSIFAVVGLNMKTKSHIFMHQDSDSIWRMIEPEKEEMHLSKSIRTPPPGVPSECDWSEFDIEILKAAKIALERLSHLFRLQSGVISADKLDLPSIIEVFSVSYNAYTTSKKSTTKLRPRSKNPFESVENGYSNANEYAFLKSSTAYILEGLLVGVHTLCQRSLLKKENDVSSLISVLRACSAEENAFISRIARHTLDMFE